MAMLRNKLDEEQIKGVRHEEMVESPSISVVSCFNLSTMPSARSSAGPILEAQQKEDEQASS